METAFQFPAAAPDDPSDVALAVQTAGALWRQGDSREALKWLRRAAESAETEGDDMRALTLARAAADLKDRLPHLTSVPPPPTSAAPAPAPTRVSAPPSVAPSPSAAPAPRSQIPPAPALVSSLSTDLGLGPQKLEAWVPPSSRAAAEAATPAPAPVAAAPAPAPVVAAPAPAPSAAPPASAPAPAPSAVPPASAPLREPVAPATAVTAAMAVVAAEEPNTPVARPISAGSTDARVALRVSVEMLSKGSGSLLVRVLGEGEDPPPGAREALLVPLDSGVDLRNP